MSGTISTRWYFSDWMSDPSVRACSLAARGLWMDLLCLASSNKGTDYGFVMIAGRKIETAAIARMVGSTETEVETLLDELAQNGVFSRDRRGVIYCRRMVKAEKNRVNGQLGGNPDFGSKPNQRRGLVPPSLRTKRRVFSAEERLFVFNSRGGKCHWCKKELLLEYPYKDSPPENLMHVDHIVAICDGGTNEAGNLTAACRACNANRSLVVSNGNYNENENRPPVSPKPHIPEPEPEPLFSNENSTPTRKSAPSKNVGESPPADDWPEDYLAVFWNAYPPFRRTAKKTVATKLATIRKSGEVTFERLMDGLRRYCETNPGEYAKGPVVWLSGGCWDDVHQKSNVRKPTRNGFAALLLENREREHEQNFFGGGEPIIDAEPLPDQRARHDH